MLNEFEPVGQISYNKKYCFVYNEVSFKSVKVEVFGFRVPFTTRLCLN